MPSEDSDQHTEVEEARQMSAIFEEAMEVVQHQGGVQADPAPQADAEDGAQSSSSTSSKSSTPSSSTSSSPPSPPPAQAAAAPEARGSADLSVQVRGGTIRWYANKNFFTATCTNARHGKCVMTRTGEPSARVGRCKGQGRPLGFFCSLACNRTRTKLQSTTLGQR